MSKSSDSEKVDPWLVAPIDTSRETLDKISKPPNMMKMSPEMRAHIAEEEAASVRLLKSVSLPMIANPAERKNIINETLDLSKRNPIPLNAKRLSRDEMHDR